MNPMAYAIAPQKKYLRPKCQSQRVVQHAKSHPEPDHQLPRGYSTRTTIPANHDVYHPLQSAYQHTHEDIHTHADGSYGVELADQCLAVMMIRYNNCWIKIIADESEIGAIATT